MSQLAQLGVFTTVLGGVIMFLGLFPEAVDAAFTASIGLLQIFAMLTGLLLLVAGAYIVAYAMIHRGKPGSLMRDIGLRMGLTGFVLAAAATLSDAMGYGSHVSGEGLIFGWLQTAGMMAGFVLAAAGVLVYGMANS